MFARVFQHVIAGEAFAIAAAIALTFGVACKGPDSGPNECSECYAVTAWGANVIPEPAPADTAARARVVFNAETLLWGYTVTVAPTGTIDSIALYEVPAGVALPVSATATLCAGAAACAASSGTATLVPPATTATIRTSLRAYGIQLVVFTTTAQKAAGGAMRGTMYPNP